MAVPAFEFTTRATPLVQMGRSVYRQLGNHRWGTAHWGDAQWGKDDWEPVWTDLTCEVHEITTNTGRGGATDRFTPGTAEIVASNVTNLSEIIFPPVPVDSGSFQYVPQPPISHEEDLQAPNATTVTSNGWSFTDDFETAPPRWVFPSAYATGGTYPTRPMVWGDGYVAPEMYGPGTGYFEAHGAMQWTGPHPYPETVAATLSVEDLAWAAAPTTGTPQVIFEIYAYGNTTSRACSCARFTLTPVFSGNNTAVVDRFLMGADGSRVSGLTVTNFTSGLGSNGVFGDLDLWVTFDPVAGVAYAGINGLSTAVNSFSSYFAAGSRVGFAVHYIEGTVAGTSPGGPRVVGFATYEFEDDFTRSPGSGWKVNPRMAEYGPMLVEGGAMRPPAEFGSEAGSGIYFADGAAQWVSEFDGDQFIEAELSGMSMPDVLAGPCSTSLELYLKGNGRDLRSVVALIDYVVDWSPDDCSIEWRLVQYGPNGDYVFDPDVEDVSFGSIELGVTNGVFPEPDRWRLEADTLGDVRLYRQGTLLGDTVFPDIPDGGGAGVYMGWSAGGPAATGDLRPQMTRIEQISAGLQEPLGAEELGMWVRIGVDHSTLGERWFFRGFVDAVVPTYLPEHQDAVRIECIDSLGEAGRVYVNGETLPGRFQGAPARIRQILTQASWPQKLRDVRDDSTQLSRPANGKAVDLLTHVAESCGGAVYGDPDTGNIVFRGQDWQGHAASDPAQAYLTNFHPDIDDGVPRVCPVGWERSARRSDMATHVRFSSITSDSEDGAAIVREWRASGAERIYGVELYERTLLATTVERLNELANRHLRLRHPNHFPRIEAVVLDAATEEAALDLMTTSTFTRPSKYWCQHRNDAGQWVFNRAYLVTGVRHRIRPTQWTCRLALDPSSVFAETGGRWGTLMHPKARWGRDVWGRTR